MSQVLQSWILISAGTIIIFVGIVWQKAIREK